MGFYWKTGLCRLLRKGNWVWKRYGQWDGNGNCNGSLLGRYVDYNIGTLCWTLTVVCEDSGFHEERANSRNMQYPA
jgi:hypothetical protein